MNFDHRTRERRSVLGGAIPHRPDVVKGLNNEVLNSREDGVARGLNVTQHVAFLLHNAANAGHDPRLIAREAARFERYPNVAGGICGDDEAIWASGRQDAGKVLGQPDAIDFGMDRFHLPDASAGTGGLEPCDDGRAPSLLMRPLCCQGDRGGVLFSAVPGPIEKVSGGSAGTPAGSEGARSDGKRSQMLHHPPKSSWG
jgi:hypothetical protein